MYGVYKMKNIKLQGVKGNHIATAQLILDSVNYDSLADTYDNAQDMDFITLCQCFVSMAEDRHRFKGDERPQVTVVREFIESLPTELSLPYENYDILEWQKKQGIIKDNSSDAQKEIAIDNYWRFIPLVIKKYGV